MPPKISSFSCGFVLRDAVSQIQILLLPYLQNI